MIHLPDTERHISERDGIPRSCTSQRGGQADLPRPSESSMRGACQGPTRENAFSGRRKAALRVYYGDERYCDTYCENSGPPRRFSRDGFYGLRLKSSLLTRIGGKSWVQQP